ncbi:BZ3500_MvSof-1268-A1-R1_Chr9g10683 [Microbotryum saponariae]|uniref:BZ3500_MvSof-1268-A1-R1_Chr9g10683 protein n=1 Tax=Microbotryum saponariae TaxID=289078 RepID=A0A2X0MDV2_9BASI|nr:BZ3501_MvSof-1269-A2-R1_Chr9g10431 [Microbotryum saponariae]SDA00515.1 BZ3500_MvSof-1268-A1-R1_Chr9g10683 [Microbotryum saponariae]
MAMERSAQPLAAASQKPPRATGSNRSSAAPQGARNRPILRFTTPAVRGPGWEPSGADRDEENYGRLRQLRPFPVHQHHHHLDEKHADGTDGSVRTGHSHGLSSTGKRVARALIHDILACVGEFVGTCTYRTANQSRLDPLVYCLTADVFLDSMFHPLSTADSDPVLFLFLAFQGAQSATYNRGAVNNQSLTTTDNQTILYIALSFGFSLVVVAWAFFRITGSAFNPAVTLALWLVGGLSSRRAVGVVIAQLLGGIAAAGLSKGVTLGTFSVQNSLVVGLSSGKGLVIEMLTTALLCFTVLMLAAEKSRSTFLAPVAIGLALFVGHLASIGWTGAGINPARTFGPCVVSGSFPHNAWLYYVGQFLGSLLSTAIYVLLKHLDYEEVVGSIDSADASQSAAIDGAPLMKGLANTANLIPGVQIGDEPDTDATSHATVTDDAAAMEEGKAEHRPGGTLTEKA